MFSMDRGFAINASNRSLVTTASVAERRKAVTANFGNGGGAGQGSGGQNAGPGGAKNSLGQSVSSTNVNLMTLDGIISDDRSIRNRIFKDIYFHDAVGGGAVEALSFLPFGDFHLTGIRDKKRLEKFAESTAMTHPMDLLPQIARQYLVLGCFLGTKNWNVRDKICTGVVPHDTESIKAINIPVTGAQPIFDLTLDKNFINLMKNNKDPRVKAVIDKLPEFYKTQISSGMIELQPQNTIFVARRTLAGDIMGTSYFERILPLHLIEKAITRGTIDAANRRQRPLLHIQLGGEDDWVPNMEDLNACRDAFMMGDMDPQGAIVVTRTGVTANEMRSPTDFWSIEAVDQWTSPVKYRALGMSDDIINGTASLSTLDASMSILVTNLRTFRRYIEREVFTNNLFADIALANDYKRTGGHTVLGAFNSKDIGEDHPLYDMINYSMGRRGVRDISIYANDRFYGDRDFKGNLVDLHNYDIPEIVWHQSLSPEGDTAYFEMLTQALEHGIPVPMTMLAAAAGLDINRVLAGSKGDIDIRKRASKVFDDIRQLSPQADQSQVTAALAAELGRRQNLQEIGLKNRIYKDTDHCHNTYADGRYRVTTAKEKKRREESLIRKASQALASNAARTNHGIKITPKNIRPMWDIGATFK